MHEVVGDLVLLDGAECAQTHMERDECGIYAVLTQLTELLISKMQSCGWCGCRACLMGIHRLITLLVRQLLRDIGREGHLAYLVEYLIEIAVILEMGDAVAVLDYIGYLRAQLAAAEYEPCAGLRLLARTAEYLPCIESRLPEQQELDE